MGINDLLKLYKPIIKNMNISELQGKCAGVDIMVWLYRGVYAAMNNSTQEDYCKSDLYLNFPLKMFLLLKEKGIKCIAVFDGNSNEAKFSELKNRVDAKKTNRQLALSLAKEGKEEESKKVMKRTLKIKSRMTNTLITILKKLEIPVLVAPYEADSQLAYLYEHNIIDFVISEDSDLIPYGIERIAFKLDSYGNMSYLDLSMAKKSTNSIKDECCNWLLSIPHYKLVSFCVMLGCDYLSSIKGFGTVSGMKLFKSVSDINQAIDRMIISGKYIVESNYLNKVKKAISVFYMQTVYDPRSNSLKPLTDFQCYYENDSIEDLILKSELFDLYIKDKNYYGPFFEDYEDYCKGNIDIKTKSKEIRIEPNEVIEKYLRRYSNLLKPYYDVKVLSFNKKADYITISKEEKPRQQIDEFDIETEIKFLTNEIKNNNYISINIKNNVHAKTEKELLNHKRHRNIHKEDEQLFDEQMLLSSIEKLIQEEENNKHLEIVSNTLNENNNIINMSQTKYANMKWKVSNNADIKQSNSATIINDIQLLK